MTNFIRATFSIDEQTRALLEKIAENESEFGERVNESQSLRRMIRERAAKLGLSLKQEPEPKPKGKAK